MAGWCQFGLVMCARRLWMFYLWGLKGLVANKISIMHEISLVNSLFHGIWIGANHHCIFRDILSMKIYMLWTFYSLIKGSYTLQVLHTFFPLWSTKATSYFFDWFLLMCSKNKQWSGFLWKTKKSFRLPSLHFTPLGFKRIPENSIIIRNIYC